MRAGLAILGCGPSVWKYVELCMRERGKPFSEVWGINRIAFPLKVDRIIAMDDRRWLAAHPEFSITVEALERLGTPIYTSQVYPEYPNSVPYPLEAVEELLGKYHAEPWRLLNNSASYALALALFKRWGSVHVFGCNFFDTTAYATPEARKGDPWWRVPYYPENQQKVVEPGIESFNFLVGLAAGLGVGIVVHHSEDCKPFRYGYHEEPND